MHLSKLTKLYTLCYMKKPETKQNEGSSKPAVIALKPNKAVGTLAQA